MLALARKMVTGDGDAGLMELVFEEARQVEADADALLLDDGWAPPEPVAAEVVGGGAGARDSRDDAGEVHGRSFSWGELMAEGKVRAPNR